jgi:predicted phage tail protein
MGLSEQEQKLLDELEKSLTGKHSARVIGKPKKGEVSAKRVILGSVVAVAGIGVLLAGVMNQLIPLGIVGFALMLGGVYLAASTNTAK